MTSFQLIIKLCHLNNIWSRAIDRAFRAQHLS